MEENKKQIYRTKSLERISSPEQMNSTIKVTKPGTWILMGAVIALLIGGLIWCIVIKLEIKTVPAAAIVKNGEMELIVSADGKKSVTEGMTLSIGEYKYELPECDFSAVKLFENTDQEVIDIVGNTDEEYAYMTWMYIDLPNGIYEATIATEEISPMELIFN